MEKKKLKELMIGVAAAVAAIFLLCTVFGYSCPMRILTGYPCPGCGMTRAYFALLKGDVKLAFYYHPLFLLPIPLVLLIIFEKRMPKKLNTALLSLIVFLFILVYIIRMSKGSPVLQGDYHEGIIWRSLYDGINWIMPQK